MKMKFVWINKKNFSGVFTTTRCCLKKETFIDDFYGDAGFGMVVDLT
jgi:hypothetical protein